MASVDKDVSIQQFQEFIRETYILPNSRYFELSDMLTNIGRFAMRALKGIRKSDIEKAKKNLVISFSWFMSAVVRLHIDIQDEIWKRFPNLCSYCGSCPCSCKENRVEQRKKVVIDNSRKPATLSDFQKMFNCIYPPNSRTLEHAGVHFAEEVGEFSESLLAYRSERSEDDFNQVMLEAADFFSCLIGIFNSLKIDLAEELSAMYYNNCHECHNAPCSCSFAKIKSYKS